jgi:hypothetical protein
MDGVDPTRDAVVEDWYHPERKYLRHLPGQPSHEEIVSLQLNLHSNTPVHFSVVSACPTTGGGLALRRALRSHSQLDRRAGRTLLQGRGLLRDGPSHGRACAPPSVKGRSSHLRASACCVLHARGGLEGVGAGGGSAEVTAAERCGGVQEVAEYALNGTLFRLPDEVKVRSAPVSRLVRRLPLRTGWVPHCFKRAVRPGLFSPVPDGSFPASAPAPRAPRAAPRASRPPFEYR